MKPFFVLAVAAATIMLLVQGAPPGQVTSEEMGKVVEELKEMIKSEAAKLASHPQGQGYGRHVSIIMISKIIQLACTSINFYYPYHSGSSKIH